MQFTLPEIKEGEINAGLIMALDGIPSHWVILLPGDKDDGNWEDAGTWATEQGGELPTRAEQSLLFANTKDKFQRDWYWSAEEDGSEWAWCQDFDNGYQGDVHESDNGCRARAVRRISAI